MHVRVRNLAQPPSFVGWRVVEAGDRMIVIVRFGMLRRRYRSSFGIHLKRLQDAIYIARSLDASLYLLWYRAAPNQAAHRMSSRDVRVIPTSRTRDMLVTAFWWATTPLAALERLAYPTWRRLDRRRQELGKEHAKRKGADGSAGRARRLAVRAAAGALRWSEPVQAPRGKSLRLEMAADPIRLVLAPALENRARREAERLGLAPDERIVTLHVREHGWRPLDEPDPRSCDIDTYRAAVDDLVQRGFRIVRIGDATMTPIDWPGVIDLATSSARSDLVELWCMLHSTFFLGSESGPLELAKLIGVPTLLVNVKTIQSGYPLHSTDIFILKRLLSATEPRVLSLREQLAVKARQIELGGPVRYLDNTAEEICSAVEEMLRGLDQRSPETVAQAEFLRLASTKTSPTKERRRYLGEGRLAAFFAERHLDHGEDLPADEDDRSYESR